MIFTLSWNIAHMLAGPWAVISGQYFLSIRLTAFLWQTGCFCRLLNLFWCYHWLHHQSKLVSPFQKQSYKPKPSHYLHQACMFWIVKPNQFLLFFCHFITLVGSSWFQNFYGSLYFLANFNLAFWWPACSFFAPGVFFKWWTVKPSPALRRRLLLSPAVVVFFFF